MAITISSQWDAEVFEREKEEARKHINSQWDAKVFYETYGGNGSIGNWGQQRNNYGGTYYQYNPVTREWKKFSASSFNTEGFKSSATLNAGALSFSADSSGAISQSGVTNSSKDAKTDSKKNAEKKFIEIEFNTLVGEINLIPTKENMRIKANNTIRVNGVGKYLSGLYFVSEVKKTLNESGYNLSLTLYKNGFGDSLKNPKVTTVSNRPEQVDISNNIVQNNIKVGDKVKIVGESAVYANAHEGIKVPDHIKSQILTVTEISTDNLRARLSPINSWTYLKFLQLV